jgi:hypothetical protein
MGMVARVVRQLPRRRADRRRTARFVVHGVVSTVTSSESPRPCQQQSSPPPAAGSGQGGSRDVVTQGHTRPRHGSSLRQPASRIILVSSELRHVPSSTKALPEGRAASRARPGLGIIAAWTWTASCSLWSTASPAQRTYCTLGRLGQAARTARSRTWLLRRCSSRTCSSRTRLVPAGFGITTLGSVAISGAPGC